MTVEDGCLRTDGIIIEPCCKWMAEHTRERNGELDDATLIVSDSDGIHLDVGVLVYDSEGWTFASHVLGDTLDYCFKCGAKLELLNKVKDKTGE